MRGFLKGLIYENGAPSRTGLCGLLTVLIPLFVWTIVTIYLVWTKQNFVHYTDMTYGVFGTSATGGAVVAGNKWINSTKNAIAGLFPNKSAEGCATEAKIEDVK